ncbi:MAG: radical SAM protein [Anaerocolumna sp.]
MKIVFANLCDYQNIFKDSQVPLGILSLATIIKNAGKYEAGVIDFNRLYCEHFFVVSNILDQNISRDAGYLLEQGPDVISLYTMCNTYHVALLLALKIKGLNDKIKVLFGGPQATLAADKTLEKYNCVDAIGLGEGENTIISILNGIESGDLSNVNGIAYKDEGKITVRRNEDLIGNLDELPMIDLDLYHHKLENRISMDIGRGCPYNCIFCSTKLFWKRKFRIKSAKRILEEIVYYRNKFNFKEFNFEHDLFVANRKLVMDLCKMLKEGNINISWACSARVDTIDEELLQVMGSAGCEEIFFGIESGSEKIQKYIKKNLDLAQIGQLPLLLHKYNIKGTFSFIYGFPKENEKDIDDTLKLIYRIYDKCHKDVTEERLKLQLHKIMFLPKTEITEKHMDKLVHPKDFSMEIFESLDSWRDERLSEMIKDVDLFPNLCYIPSPLADKIKNLDKFYHLVFIKCIALFDITYKFLLEEMKDSCLGVFYAFRSVISEQEMMENYKIYFKEHNIFVDRMIEVLERFIGEYPFVWIETEALNAMFHFERDIYQLLFKSRNEKKNIDVIREYSYDVLQMRKRRITLTEKRITKVRFYIENEKYIMKKAEQESGMEKGLYSILI